MERNILVAIILIFLLSPTYSMSNDGGNVPVVKMENTSEEVTQIEQQPSSALEQSTKVKSHETVKDHVGLDTGMSKDELEKFKSEYKKKFVELFPNLTESTSEWYFDNKINLNKVNEFEKYGLYLNISNIPQGTSYKKNALLSDVIVTGKIVELIQKDDTFVPRYKLEIDQIIHGSEVIKIYRGEIPRYIYFVAFLGASIDRPSLLNKKGIYFLYINPLPNKEFIFLKRHYSNMTIYNDSIVCYERDFHKFDSAFKYIHGKLELSKMQKDNNYGERYLRWYDECEIGSWDETIENIRKILEINDDKNFYKRNYRSEGE